MLIVGSGLSDQAPVAHVKGQGDATFHFAPRECRGPRVGVAARGVALLAEHGSPVAPWSLAHRSPERWADAALEAAIAEGSPPGERVRSIVITQIGAS